MNLRILADMGVSTSVVEGLKMAGYDAIHIRERLPVTAEDEEILAVGASEQRIIVTMDHDFGDLLFHRGAKTPSLIFFRVNDERPASVLGRLKLVLATVADDLTSGAIVVVEDARIRVRPLPIVTGNKGDDLKEAP
jgi:predicted nuclease of predicted toxin-antitoxin system